MIKEGFVKSSLVFRIPQFWFFFGRSKAMTIKKENVRVRTEKVIYSIRVLTKKPEEKL